MQADDGLGEHAEEALVDRALRGPLSADDHARLEQHLKVCATCAAEVEALRVFDATLAPGPADDALDRAAVDGAMARLAGRPGSVATLAPEWHEDALNQAAVDAAMARLRERPTPRLRLRPAAGYAALGAAAAVAAAIALFHGGQGRQPAPEQAATVVPAGTLVLDDGSEIAPEDASTSIRVDEQTPQRTTVHLPSGRARFRVHHDGRRVFRVEAGAIEIQDLGTVFRVAHEADGRVRVAVSEGRVAVRVAATGLRLELGAGDDRVFSAAAAGDALAPAAAPVAPPPASAQAPAAVRGQPRAHLSDDPAELLVAADLARRAHEPRAAVAPLRRLVERHPKDPRAPSAAFTLGWVLLTELNRPREAATAFADAERIAPRGALAEDAAARVAEAWQKAGDSRRAADAARHYAQVYPTGRYIALMRGLIGAH